MAVEFMLLGDIEARVDGQRLELGHSRQRCVLVALLIDADRPVPADRLVERVWGTNPPGRAHGTLYSYLSRLRQVLGSAGDVALRRQPGGYVLAVESMAVDLHRFHRLVGHARATDDRAQARTLLEQALGLWHGVAFAELDTPWLNTLRDVLDVERLTAELDYHDLVLESGGHGELLARLSSCAATYPLDERLAGQLMLALYRAGRQADALDHYQRMRRRLAEDLGADPGRTLQRLHQQILAADETLAAPLLVADPPSRRPQATTPVPRQLPAPLPSFTGRVVELARLSAMARHPQDQHAPVAIGAAGGMGKTCLAVRWANDNLDLFPDGHLYANLRGFDPSGEPVDPAAVLRTFLETLGVPPEAIPVDTDARSGLYRGLVAGKRMLILLDNARDSEHVIPLLPGASTSTVLVTSRHDLTGLVTAHGAQRLTLDVLDESQARQLLAAHLGTRRIAAEPDATDALLRHCAGLPLALSIVAARAAAHPGFPLAALADELATAATRLDALDAGELAVNLRAVLSCSYHALSQEAAEVFGILGLAPGPDVSLCAAASLTAIPAPRLRALLRELTNAHMEQQAAPDRYRMHDLVRLYAAERARARIATDMRRTALHRLLDHYLHTAYAADRLLHPHRDPIVLDPPAPGVSPEHLAGHAHALAWFSAQHAALLEAIRYAADHGFDTHAWNLAWTFVTYADRRGHWHDQAITQRCALDAARRLADRRAQAHAHRGLALAYVWIERYGDARIHLLQALDLFTALDDLTGQAHAHRSLARVSARQGRHDEALPHDQQALRLYRTAGHQAGQADALNAVGWHLAHMNRPREALAFCEAALSLHQELGDRRGMALTWDSLGYAHHDLGHHEQAIACYQHALVAVREIGHRHTEGETLTRLGDAYHSAGTFDAACDAWSHALTIFSELGHTVADEVRARLLARDAKLTDVA